MRVGDISDSEINPMAQSFIDAFNLMTGRVFKTAEEHGFWEGVDPTDLNVIGTKLMLAVGELSEAMESVRKDGLDARCDKPVDISALEEEFADTIIRIMDTAKKLGLNLGRAIVLKAKYNDDRPYKHNKKF